MPKIFRQGFYNHVPGRQHDNGAEAIAFVPMWELTGLETMYGGWSGWPTGWLSTVQPPQVYHNLAVPDAGIGGLQAGQLFSQQLSDGDYNSLE